MFDRMKYIYIYFFNNFGLFSLTQAITLYQLEIKTSFTSSASVDYLLVNQAQIVIRAFRDFAELYSAIQSLTPYGSEY